MSRRRRVLRDLWVLAPVLGGLVLAGLANAGLVPNPVLYLRADAATLVVLLGLLMSLPLTVGRIAWRRRRIGWERALADERARQAEGHRRFIQRLDHEVKNPLTAIRAALANLNSSGDEPMLATVGMQVDRLARIIGDLRKLSDLETQPLETERVDLHALLAEAFAVAGAQPGAGERQWRLNLPAAPWPLPCVAGDPDLLYLAVHNLLDNARKFTRPGDTIELRASEDGSSVTIEVADAGPGIPADELPHVGEELYRGSAARSVDGSGLGLALARAILTLHGGALSVRSRLGQGTIVTMRLPVAR